MESSVNKARSLFFIIDISPITNPATPKTAINGVGKGSLIIAKFINFKAINTIKIRIKPDAHFRPLF